MVSTKERKPFTTMFGFQQDCMIVSYCPKKNKTVNLLSTLHSEPKVDTSNEQRKPEVILTYNETKAGVDTMDQMTRTYSCKRKTRRWPLVVFYNMLDISAINAYVFWKALNPNWNSNKSHKRRLSPPLRKGTSRSKWRGKNSWANKRNCLWTTKRKGEMHYLQLRKG